MVDSPPHLFQSKVIVLLLVAAALIGGGVFFFRRRRDMRLMQDIGEPRQVELGEARA